MFRWIPVGVLLFVAVLSVSSGAEGDEVFNQIGILRGQMIITNHPTLGRTPASGEFVALQRTDCRQCLFGVRTDVQGQFSAFLGIGRYRVLVGDQDRVEIVPREFTVEPPSKDTVVNFELKLRGR